MSWPLAWRVWGCLMQQLKEGYYADIVVLDKNSLKANADAISGGKAPDGIEYVLINGKIAAKHKKHTGVLAGKVLRRG